MRFHGLRHTFASLMIHSREQIIRVQSALGPASPAIMLSVYSHLLPLEDAGATRRLDQLIGFEASSGSETVAKAPSLQERSTKVVDKMVAKSGIALWPDSACGEIFAARYAQPSGSLVAKGGIEPPTQGFSVRRKKNST
jgi:hypothetical protein